MSKNCDWRDVADINSDCRTLPKTESLPLEGFHLRHLRLLDFVVSLSSRDPESTATVSVLRVYCNEVLHPGTLLFSSHNAPSTENPTA